MTPPSSNPNDQFTVESQNPFFASFCVARGLQYVRAEATGRGTALVIHYIFADGEGKYASLQADYRNASQKVAGLVNVHDYNVAFARLKKDGDKARDAHLREIALQDREAEEEWKRQQVKRG